ncbi:MAG: hypothetical protein IKM23_09975 [Bacteroidales bacterium]|nr:hypothetical protein [Bacteroidales bacterium]
MKKFKFVAIAILAIVLVTMQSCKKEEIETIPENKEYNDRSDMLYNIGLDIDNDVMPPIITSNLPVFPLEVLYVVCKEYESVVDSTSSKSIYKNRHILTYSKNEYAESRLIDLYPNKAYVGIVEDSQDFYDSVMNVYNSYPYLEGSTGYGINGAILPDEESEYISDENEVNLLEMTVNETIRFEAMNSLARMSGFATLDDISKASGNTMILQQDKFDWVFFGMVAVIVGSYVYNRAKICKDRALEKTDEYYKNDVVKADVFRHIFVNVLLRNDISKTMAYFIMDVCYETLNPNPPCHLYMDWHNNYVGRVKKYSTFKAGNGWEKWGQNVRNYVNNTNNGVYKSWTKDTVKKTVKKEEKNVDDNKYIYLNENQFK